MRQAAAMPTNIYIYISLSLSAEPSNDLFLDGTGSLPAVLLIDGLVYGRPAMY